MNTNKHELLLIQIVGCAMEVPNMLGCGLIVL